MDDYEKSMRDLIEKYKNFSNGLSDEREKEKYNSLIEKVEKVINYHSKLNVLEEQIGFAKYEVSILEKRIKGLIKSLGNEEIRWN
jgi:hypothetical protein